VKKIHSLKGRNSFKEVFSRGRRYNTEGVQLIVLKRDGGIKGSHGPADLQNGESRLGISIGRSYGNAVQRNRAKRRIRAMVRELLPAVKKGYYIIIRPGKGFQKAEYTGASANIRCLFKKAGIVSS